MDESAVFLSKVKTGRVQVSGCRLALGISRTDTMHELCFKSGEAFVISWIIVGDGFHEENGRRFPIVNGSVCIRRPDRSYRYYLGDTESIRLYIDLPVCMYETLELLIPELAHISAVRPAPFRTELIEEFELMRSELRSLDQTEIYRILPRLISFILNLTGISADRASTPLSFARTLLADAESSLTIEQIAERCGMNYNTFRKHFTDSYGQTPHSYRTACRMEAACQALSVGETVTSIANRLGFSDSSSFTHRFTAELGVSPSKYRERIRGS